MKRIWYWRSSNGIRHRPHEMETKYLFYVLKMLWNHFMPEEARIEPYVERHFGKAYPEEYLREAIQKIGRELLTRRDMYKAHRREFERMLNWTIITETGIEKFIK